MYTKYNFFLVHEKVLNSFPRLHFEIFAWQWFSIKYIFSERGDFLRIIAIALFLYQSVNYKKDQLSFLFVWNLQVKSTVISTRECKIHWIRATKKRYGHNFFRLLFGGYENFYRVTEKQICMHDDTPPVGSRPDTCKGDSGGPMMCGSGHNVLAGVTSWGESTCSGTLPSVYTRVSKYRGWIYQHARV